MKKTALHAAHISAGAKMGGFAGYDMPLYYGEGVIKEHEWVRSSCGLFDVSHMGQALAVGEGCKEFAEKITPSSFDKLTIGRTKYTVLTNENGGIIDDLMITHAGENAYNFVLNAGRKDVDLAWIRKHLPENIELTYHDDWALLALQGPKAEQALKEATGIDLSDMNYMDVREIEKGKMYISRLGYTGEDGFEIAVPNADAPALWDKLTAHDAVKPIGLAARDSLRLEMGYALYGHEIDETTSPIEAGLNWVTSKDNTTCFGAETIQAHRENGVTRKLVGLKLIDRGVAREGTEILDTDKNKIGVMTSGGHSPTLKASIGMGYVTPENAKAGTEIFVDVRGRQLKAEVTKLPFVEAGTKTKKKAA